MKSLISIIIVLILIAIAWNYYDKEAVSTTDTQGSATTNTNTTNTGNTNNTNTTMNQEFNWVGKYDAYTQVEGANDGSRLYKLEITKNGDKYDVSYHTSSMTRENYKGLGLVRDAKNLDVVFVSSDYEYANKNYDKGDTFMLLEMVSKNEVKMTQVQPEIDKDIPVKTITLRREGSGLLDM